MAPTGLGLRKERKGQEKVEGGRNQSKGVGRQMDLYHIRQDRFVKWKIMNGHDSPFEATGVIT